MRLTDEERASPAWQKLRRYMEDELATLRIANDASDLDPISTARLRGRIAELKTLLALGKPAPVLGADESAGE